MSTTDFDAGEIKALVFDIFGTVVDWRSSVIREGQKLSAQTGLQADWPALADAWRAGYQPAMQRARNGEIAWTNIDGLHRVILEELLPRFGLTDMTEAQRDHLNRAWHRLDPWPDSVAGLRRLKKRFVISTLSNGNVALLVNMAKHARLPWDCVLSAEIIQKYKPDPEVYQMAASLLGFERDQVLMVAAHPSDLRGAQRAGLRTAYVPRPLEHGEGGWVEPVGDTVFDVVAPDFNALAQALGV
ncbi:MAG: haloacid dehalogenase type II [Burkholderiaceae bacterium]